MNSPSRDLTGDPKLNAGQRIDEICDAFEAEWIAGRQPQIEDYLLQASQEIQIELLQELVALDVDYRRKAGEQPSAEEYARRFENSLASRNSASAPAAENKQVLELVAYGPKPAMTWRHVLVPDQTIRLGRAPQEGWSVPWDLRISREHADLTLGAGQLHVSCVEAARNAAFVKRQRLREFAILPGQYFRIGETFFRLEYPTDVAGDSSCHDSDQIDLDQQPTADTSNPFVEDTRPAPSARFFARDADPPLFAGEATSEDGFDPYHRWLSIPPSQQPAHYYGLLGISIFEDDPRVIEEAAERQTFHLRRHQSSQYAEQAEQIQIELDRARICLLHEPDKEAYDRRLNEHLAAQEDSATAGSGPPLGANHLSVNLARFLDELNDSDQHWRRRKRK